MLETEENTNIIPSSPDNWFTYKIFKQTLKLIYAIYYDTITIQAIQKIEEQYRDMAKAHHYRFIVSLRLSNRLNQFRKLTEILNDALESIHFADKTALGNDQVLPFQSVINLQILQALKENSTLNPLVNSLLRFQLNNYIKLFNTYCKEPAIDEYSLLALTNFIASMCTAMDKPEELKTEMLAYKIEETRLQTYLNRYAEQHPNAEYQLLNHFNTRKLLGLFIKKELQDNLREIKEIEKSDTPVKKLVQLSKTVTETFSNRQQEWKKHCSDVFLKELTEDLRDFLKNSYDFIIEVYQQLEIIVEAIKKLPLTMPPLTIPAQLAISPPATPATRYMLPTSKVSAASKFFEARPITKRTMEQNALSQIEQVIEGMRKNFFYILQPDQVQKVADLMSTINYILSIANIATSMVHADKEERSRLAPIKDHLEKLNSLLINHGKEKTNAPDTGIGGTGKMEVSTKFPA